MSEGQELITIEMPVSAVRDTADIASWLSRAQAFKENEQLSEAEFILQNILLKEPSNSEALQLMGNVLYADNNFEKALYYYNLLFQCQQGSSVSVVQMMRCFFHLKKYSEALVCAEQALAISPTSLDALYGKALILFEQTQYRDAIGAFKEMLILNPQEPRALKGLAIQYTKMAKIDKAMAMYRASFDVGFYTMELMLNYIWLLSDITKEGRLALLEETVDGFLKTGAVSKEDRYYFLISLAKAAFLENSPEKVEGFLSEVVWADLPKHEKSFAKGLKTYYLYLSSLVEYRRTDAAKSLYIAKEDSDKLLHVVGESHALESAFTRCMIGGESYYCLPSLITGVQARHLVHKNPPIYHALIERRLLNLEKGSTVLLCFGEIDCRYNDGIIPYLLKYNRWGDRQQVVSEIVEAYVTLMAKYAKRRKLTLLLNSVPALHEKHVGLSSESRRQVKEVIALFNTELKRLCERYQFFYVDTYGYTKGEDGFGKDKLYLDRCHLKPFVLQEILKNAVL